MSLECFYLGIRQLYQNTAVLVFFTFIFHIKKKKNLPLSASSISSSLSKGGFGLSSLGKTGSKWQAVMETVSWVISCFNCLATKKKKFCPIRWKLMTPCCCLLQRRRLHERSLFPPPLDSAERTVHPEGEDMDWGNEWGCIRLAFCSPPISLKAVTGVWETGLRGKWF